MRNNDDRQRRILQAEQLLGNDLLQEVITKLEEKYTKLAFESGFTEQYKRDFGYMGIKVLDDMKNYLQVIIKSGRLK